MNYELKEHQVQALEFLAKTPKAALFMATGTGKTIVTLLYLKELKKSTVVVVEASKKHIWTDENEKFGLGLDMSADWRIPGDIVIVSYDWLKYNAEFLDDYEVVVFDEAHCISSPNTARYKNLYSRVRQKQYVVLLSGYPVENHLQEIYVISLISDVLGKNYYHFLNKFFHVIRKGGRIVKVSPRKDSFSKIIDLIKPIAFVVDKEKVMPKGLKKESMIVRFELSDGQKGLIRDLQETGTCTIDCNTINCCNRLVAFQKILQIVSGFIYISDDEREVWPRKFVNNPKLDLLNDLVGKRSNFLLWYMYDAEYDMLRDFEDRARLCKLQKDSRGLNLQHYKFSVYYGFSLSGGQYMQSQDRLYRLGRTEDVITVTLLPNGEFGDRLSDMMNRKQTLTDKFIKSLLRCKI